MKTKDKELASKLRALQAYRSYSHDDMGIKIHASRRTWLRKLAKPETFTVAELIRLEKCFGTKLLETECSI